MIADNHNHYVLCGTAAEMVTCAAAAGLAEFAITEHVFHLTDARDRSSYLRTRWLPEGPPRSHATYVEDVRAAAATVSMPVRLGIELEHFPDDSELVSAQRAIVEAFDHEWDIVIGSVHCITDDRDVFSSFDDLDPRDVWTDYLVRQRDAVETGIFDVIAHPVRLAAMVRPPDSIARPLLDDLARAASSGDVALEVNGSDVRNSPAAVALLIEACARHGTVVSLGSDAHRPNSVGRARAAVERLKAAGITSTARFERRRRTLVELTGDRLRA